MILYLKQMQRLVLFSWFLCPRSRYFGRSHHLEVPPVSTCGSLTPLVRLSINITGFCSCTMLTIFQKWSSGVTGCITMEAQRTKGDLKGVSAKYLQLSCCLSLWVFETHQPFECRMVCSDHEPGDVDIIVNVFN